MGGVDMDISAQIRWGVLMLYGNFHSTVASQK